MREHTAYGISDTVPPSGPRSSGAAWWPLLGALALAAVLSAAYRFSPVTVTLAADGTTTEIETRAGSVRDLLLESGIQISPGDLVVPGPEHRIADGDRVVLSRARSVRVRADGRVVRLRTLGSSVAAVLQEAGVRLAPGDVVKLNSSSWPAGLPAEAEIDRQMEEQPTTLIAQVASRRLGSAAQAIAQSPNADSAAPQGEPQVASWDIDVYRAQRLTVVEEGIPYDLVVAGETIGEALLSAGITYYPQDRIRPHPDAPLQGPVRIDIRRATPFLVEVDGASREVRAWAETVGDGLARAGIELKGRDYAVPAVQEPLHANSLVQVVRVVEDILVREVSIPYQVEYEPDPGLDLDQKRVLVPGETGLKRQRIRITYEDGEEVARQLEEEVVLRDPVTENIAYGTHIVWNTVDTPEGPKRYWRKMRVYATSYSLSRSGTPPTAPWYGRTWLGLPMRHGIVAVDPRYVPLSANLYVPGYGIGFSGDKGGGIRGYHIDLGFDDDNYESWHWYVDLYLLEPLPGEVDMVWYLP